MIEGKVISCIFSPTKGKQYRYWTLGNKKHLPLILLSGYANKGYEDFLEIASSLQKEYFVIIPEYPGWGLSSKLPKPLTIPNYARYLHTLLRHLHVQECVLFGHCFGGIVAAEYAYLYPKDVKAVILSNTPFLEGSLMKKFYTLMIAFAKRSPRKLRPLFFFWRSRALNVPLDFFVIKTKSFRKKMLRIKNHLTNQSLDDEEAVEENWISFIEYEFTKVKKLSHPVHIIHGEKDLLVNFRQTQRFHGLFKNASLDILPEAGHVPLVESPNALVEVISRYIQS